MRALEFITGHVIYNPAYTYKFQLKTTMFRQASSKVYKNRFFHLFTLNRVAISWGGIRYVLVITLNGSICRRNWKFAYVLLIAWLKSYGYPASVLEFEVYILKSTRINGRVPRILALSIGIWT